MLCIFKHVDRPFRVLNGQGAVRGQVQLAVCRPLHPSLNRERRCRKADGVEVEGTYTYHNVGIFCLCHQHYEY